VRLRSVLLVALAALPAGPAAAQGALRGFVTDAATGGPLPGANVAVRPVGAPADQLAGAVTDGAGYYEVGGLAPGRYVARAGFVGYATRVDTLTVDGATTWSVALAAGADALGEVVVQAEGGAADVVGGLQEIRPADLARVPTPDVAGDLAAYLTALPGVVTIGDRGGGLYVRGGTPSQNLVLVDGAPVYQPFHAVGFFSAFPEDLVGQVDFWAGGYGARYTGRVSSVLDVSVREGNYREVEAQASAGPFVVGAMGEGPLGGKASWLASARRSVVEEVASALVGEDLPLLFADALVKVSHAERTSRCSATALYTYDRGALDAEADEAFAWWNGVLTGRCVLAPPELGGRLDVTLSVSAVENEVGPRVAFLRGESRERTSSVVETRFAVDLTRTLGRSRLRYGATASLYQTAYRLGEAFATARESDDTVLGGAAYAEAEVALGAGLAVTPGLALVLRPYTFGAGLEPRLRLTWQPAGRDGPEVAAAGGLYRQSIVGLVDERDAGSPFIAWAGPPPGTDETTALHALVGGSVPLPAGLRLGGEVYAKRMRSLPVPIWSALARFTTTLTTADVLATGADVRVEWAGGPATATVGYGYGVVEYEAGQDNFGVWFGEPLQRYNPPHDRRHQVQAAGQVDLGRVELTGRWQFGSGLPYTRPFGFDVFVPPVGLPDVTTDGGVTRVLFERPFNGRLPTYSRLDLSAGSTFRLGPAALDVRAGAINTYDRENVFYYDVFRARRVDQLPLVPYVSARLRTP
jgi:hypothetical protein